MVTEHLIFSEPKAPKEVDLVQSLQSIDHELVKTGIGFPKSSGSCRQNQSMKVAAQQVKDDCERNILSDHFQRWGRQIFMRNKDFIKLVKTHVLTKQCPEITNHNQFKNVVRELNIVPAYASDFKATMTYKYLSKVDDSDIPKNLDHMDLILGIFLLFSTSLKIQDLFLFDNAADSTPEDQQLLERVKAL